MATIFAWSSGGKEEFFEEEKSVEKSTSRNERANLDPTYCRNRQDVFYTNLDRIRIQIIVMDSGPENLLGSGSARQNLYIEPHIYNIRFPQ